MKVDSGPTREVKDCRYILLNQAAEKQLQPSLHRTSDKSEVSSIPKSKHSGTANHVGQVCDERPTNKARKRRNSPKAVQGRRQIQRREEKKQGTLTSWLKSGARDVRIVKQVQQQ